MLIESAVAVLICLGLMIWLLRLDLAQVTIPFSYDADAVLNSVLVKTMTDTGWVWRNPFLGAPFGTQLIDFPFYDNLNLILMKAIALFSANYAVVLNLFFLLSFPLVVVGSLLVLRSFGISYASGIVVSLLYSFLPYHFQRGEHHLFLSAYYLVPPTTMIILWIWLGGSSREKHVFSLNHRQRVCAIAIAVLLGSTVSYYTFFGCGLMVVATAISAIKFKSLARLRWGVGLAALAFLSLVVNTSPTWLYAMRHGANPQAANRIAVESETYGLKLTHLLLPIGDHRLEFLKDIRQKYNRATRDGEGQLASLGLLGDLGFFFLLGWLACSQKRRPETELITALGVLTLAAVLLGTVGGFGSLFNFLIHPQFRAYNRISVYIAFFSLFGTAILLDYLENWLRNRKNASYLWLGVLSGILILGLLDESSPSFVPSYAGVKARYLKDQAFIDQIEAAVPKGTMIFELPNPLFPEFPAVGQLRGYDELKGYLHSRSLRWSGGTLLGRPQASWPERNGLEVGIEKLDTAQNGHYQVILQLSQHALETLAFAGFGGIYLDRQGFPDSGLSTISQLQTTLGQNPLESQDHRLVFFDLGPFAKNLRAKYTSEQWQTARARALEIPSSNGQ